MTGSIGKRTQDAQRPRANADPQVQAAKQVWLARLLERMKQIDPNAQQYVDRLTQLSQGAAH